MSHYKILYVGTFKGCPNADYISDALEELGHSVTRWEESTCTPDMIINAAWVHDFILCEEGRLYGDHWSDKQGNNHIKGLWNEINLKANKPIVSWLTNIFFSVGPREMELQTNPIFKSDIVFSTDGGHQKEFEAAGVNHFLLRQGIHLPEAYIGEPTYSTNASIGFIGSIYERIWPYRARMVEFLQKTYGDKFEHFGQASNIRHDELNNLIATLKIVVGDSVQSPHYWSNRLYEMIGRGAFLIMPMVEGIDKEFIPHKHFVPYQYGDFKGLKEIIDYYLVHDKEREAIKLAGMEYCKAHHTYLHRVKEMLRVLEEQKII